MPDVHDDPGRAASASASAPARAATGDAQGAGPVVLEGTCWALFAFDAGREIDVGRAARLLGAEPSPPVGPGRPPYLQFGRPPIRATLAVAPIDVDGRRTDSNVSVVLYDFGGVVVHFSIPATGTLAELTRLGGALSATETLAVAARRVVGEVVERAASAIESPEVSALLEEYLVFHAARVGPTAPPSAWTETYAPALAAVLRAEPRPLSAQEIGQTLSAQASFTPDDLVLVDWNAAFVLRERADDLLAVLAFANVQLEEMRILDARLDDALEQAYGAIQRPRRLAFLFPGADRGPLEQIARRQIDAALLFEHVRNAPKLLGDQYLARVYEHAARRFRLADWDDSIHRKLSVLESIYERIRDRGVAARAEILEWIIIVLIFVSIVLPFVVPGGK